MSSTDSERRGILLLVVAAFSFSVMSLQVKLAGEELPVAMLVLARGVVTLVMSVAWIRYRRIPMWGVDRPRLLLRGVLGLGGLAIGLFVRFVVPGGRVHGVPDVIEAASSRPGSSWVARSAGTWQLPTQVHCPPVPDSCEPEPCSPPCPAWSAPSSAWHGCRAGNSTPAPPGEQTRRSTASQRERRMRSIRERKVAWRLWPGEGPRPGQGRPGPGLRAGPRGPPPRSTVR